MSDQHSDPHWRERRPVPPKDQVVGTAAGPDVKLGPQANSTLDPRSDTLLGLLLYERFGLTLVGIDVGLTLGPTLDPQT
jgi:hypothetical protein